MFSEKTDVPHPHCEFLVFLLLCDLDDDEESRFNDASTHEGHLRQNGVLTWFGIETDIRKW